MTAAWTSARGTVELRPAHRRWRFWLEQGRDELLKVRDYADVVPFRRGQIHRPGIADTRRLELRGYVQEVDDAAMQAQLDLLKSLLDPETDEAGILEDDFADGTHRWIRAVPRSTAAKYGGSATRMLSIELEALDPLWYSAVGALTLDTGVVLDDGYPLDAGAEIVILAAASLTDVLVDHPGSAATDRIVVRMKGPSTTAVGVANATNGVGVNTRSVLAAGQELVVDVAAKSIRLDGVTIRGSTSLLGGNRHGEYLSLVPGTNRIRIAGGPAETRLLFYPAWQ